MICTRCGQREAIKAWRDQHLCVDCYLGVPIGSTPAAAFEAREARIYELRHAPEGL